MYQPNLSINRNSLYLSYFSASLVIAFLISTTVGAYSISIDSFLQFFSQENTDFKIWFYIRLPRVVLAVIVGSSLALAGSCLQGLFRNPLADPGLIGIGSGAALAVAFWIVIMSGFESLRFIGLPAVAFVGSFASLFLVWSLAQTNGKISTVTLLLAGIAINAMAGAGIGLMQYLSDDQELRDITFWMMGTLNHSAWPSIISIIPFFLLGTLILLGTRTSLNIMSLGNSEAHHLGVNIQKVNFKVIVGSALVVGSAVSIAGGIGFIGLMVPHLIRMTFGADHRFLLPASVFSGSILLIIADSISRVIIAPAEVPVGILTAVCGTPFFMFLLWKYKKQILIN